MAHVWNVLRSNEKTVWGHGKKGLGFYRGVSEKGVYKKMCPIFKFLKVRKTFPMVSVL